MFAAAPGRNAPTVINAAFNVRNFGMVGPITSSTASLHLAIATRCRDFRDQRIAARGVQSRLALKDASAASQAVGPPGSPVEMSCGGRTFADIGRRMLDTLMLKQQRISSADSVLGPGVRRASADLS
jgi:cytochrome c peroxidase